MNNWADNIKMTVMHCDTKGKVTYMNKKCGEMFKTFGGMDLVGKNIFDCHLSERRQSLRRSWIGGFHILIR